MRLGAGVTKRIDADAAVAMGRPLTFGAKFAFNRVHGGFNVPCTPAHEARESVGRRLALGLRWDKLDLASARFNTGAVTALPRCGDC
jgi:hypothetical protein